MATKSATKKTAPVTVNIQVEGSPSTATFYVNHLEIAHSAHDFVVTGTRIPAKFSAARQQELTKTKTLTLEAEVQLTLPPSLIQPLISALQQQVASYERLIGKIATPKEPKLGK